MPKLFGLFSLLDLLEAAGLDEAPAFVSDALDAVTKLLTEAQRLQGRRSTTRRRGSRRRSPNAAHDGAQAVAQHAKDELDARRRQPRRPHLDALIAAVPGAARQPRTR